MVVGAGIAEPVGREELRELVERTLAELNADDRRGPVLRASGMSARLVISDLELVVDVAASEGPDDFLRWSFGGDADWEPEIELEMDSATAHRFLQGDESLAVAIARRRVRCSCRSRAAVAFLPAARLIAERYRGVVADRRPGPAVG